MDAERAVGLYERAIEGGRAGAMVNLGVLLEEGAKGVRKDARRAVGQYERAIEEHVHVLAMRNLAFLLMRGANGVEKDVRRATALFMRANGGV